MVTSDKCYPDARVLNGEIVDFETETILPAYEGLCLADLAGRFAIMFTSYRDGERDWEIVHFGSSLSTTEINKFMKDRS